MARPVICTEMIPAACERVGIALDQITENAQVRVSVNSIAELRAGRRPPGTPQCRAAAPGPHRPGARGTSKVARTLHAEAPLRVLAEQDTSAVLQRTAWSLPFLVSQLRKWLHDRGVAPGAATALIDAALHEQPWPAPPIIYAYLTASGRRAADAAAEAAQRQGHAQLVGPIVRAYIRRGADWPVRGTGFVRLPVGPLRRLLALLAAQPGAAAQRHGLVDELGISKRHLYRLLSGADLMGVATAEFDSRTAWLHRCTRKGMCPLHASP